MAKQVTEGKDGEKRKKKVAVRPPGKRRKTAPMQKGKNVKPKTAMSGFGNPKGGERELFRHT